MVVVWMLSSNFGSLFFFFLFSILVESVGRCIMFGAAIFILKHGVFVCLSSGESNKSKEFGFSMVIITCQSSCCKFSEHRISGKGRGGEGREERSWRLSCVHDACIIIMI